MPATTNPKKKSLMPTGPLRRQLRATGHHLRPIVQVGKEGVTDAVVRQLNQALYDHELVKVKIGTESPEDRFEAAERLALEAEAQLAQIIGRTVLVYKKHPDKPKFESAPARPAEPKAGATRKPATRPARKPVRKLVRKPARGR